MFQLQIAMSQDVCPTEKGTPCQYPVGLGLGCAPCLLFESVFKCIQPHFLLTLVGICSYLNGIGKAILHTGNHFSNAFGFISKKNPKQADTLSSWSRPHLMCFSSPSTFLHTAHKVLSASCTFPSSNKLWHRWRGITVSWQTLRIGTTVVIPGRAGQLRNS